MIQILNYYKELYFNLKNIGLEYLLNQDLTEEVKNSIKIISNLPNPSEARRDDIRFTINECLRGELRAVSEQFREIQNLAEIILHELEEFDGDEVELMMLTPQLSDEGNIEEMLRFNTEVTLNAFRLTKKSYVQSDITLKSRCPECHGDLGLFIINDELRLRCMQLRKTNCYQIDWFIQKLTR